MISRKADYKRIMEILMEEKIDFIIAGVRTGERGVHLWFDGREVSLMAMADMTHTMAHDIVDMLDEIHRQAESN